MDNQNNSSVHKFWTFITGVLFGASAAMLADQSKREQLSHKFDQLLSEVDELKKKGKTKLKKELKKAEQKL